MRRIVKFVLPMLAFASVIVSCGPVSQSLVLDMRYPSDSGLDLDGKDFSIVYVDNGNPADSSYMAKVAESFGSTLDELYPDAPNNASLYTLPLQMNADYASRDTLVNILMDTGTDVVFLMIPSLPSRFDMYAYDSMSKRDHVYDFVASDIDGYSAEKVGKVISQKFRPNWTPEAYAVSIYEEDAWYRVYDMMAQCEWQAAVDSLLKLYDNKNAVRRATAAFDLSLCCYMMGKYDLALEWLDCAVSEGVEIPNVDSMRKRILNRQKR